MRESMALLIMAGSWFLASYWEHTKRITEDMSDKMKLVGFSVGLTMMFLS
jgi:hypothetical protein